MKVPDPPLMGCCAGAEAVGGGGGGMPGAPCCDLLARGSRGLTAAAEEAGGGVGAACGGPGTCWGLGLGCMRGSPFLALGSSGKGAAPAGMGWLSTEDRPRPRDEGRG